MLKQTVEWIDLEKVMPYDELDLHQTCETRFKTDPFLVCNNKGDIELTTMTRVTYKFYDEKGENVVKTEDRWIWDSRMEDKKFWMKLPLEPRALPYIPKCEPVRYSKDVKAGMIFIAKENFTIDRDSSTEFIVKALGIMAKGDLQQATELLSQPPKDPLTIYEKDKIYASFKDGTIRDKYDNDQEVCFVGRYFTLAGYMWPMFNSFDNND